MFSTDDARQVFRSRSQTRAALAVVEQEIIAALTQRYQTAKWFRNPASETRMLEQDIPALARWYVEGARPDDDNTCRRLQAIARDVLALDPPKRVKKRAPKRRAFFVRWRAEHEYSESQDSQSGGQ